MPHLAEDSAHSEEGDCYLKPKLHRRFCAIVPIPQALFAYAVSFLHEMELLQSLQPVLQLALLHQQPLEQFRFQFHLQVQQ